MFLLEQTNKSYFHAGLVALFIRLRVLPVRFWFYVYYDRFLKVFVEADDVFSLTTEEWMNAIQFLTRVGQTCTPLRQEFILLSDVLGVSALVDGLNNPPLNNATESSILGPFFTRLVTWEVLSRPLVVTSLQRDTFSLSETTGTLSLGELPFGLADEDLTWVPVRGYPPSQGGLPPPPDAPYEVYPLVWEIPIDDVYLDGVKLPRSTLSPPSISLSALIDTVRPDIVIFHCF